MTLDEIRKLIDEATPGDWKAVEYAKAWLIEAEGPNWIKAVGSAAEADARFCAAARTLLPALLEVAEAALAMHDCNWDCSTSLKKALAALEALKLP